MSESDQNAAFKVVIYVSDSFAKWLVPRWLIPILTLAVVFGAGAVTLVERVSLSAPNPPHLEENRTVK